MTINDAYELFLLALVILGLVLHLRRALREPDDRP